MHKLASLVLILGGAMLSGQESVTLVGIIVDQSGARIPIADLRLVSPESNQVVATAKLLATADTSVGSFAITAPPLQEYELQVETLGFKIARVKIGKAEPGQKINIGKITMEVLPCILYHGDDPLVPVMRFPITETLEDIHRSVCEIVKDRARFFNTEIRLRTEIAPYGIDTGELLFDGNCPGVQLGFAPATSAVTHDWTYRTLMEYLQQQYSATATLRGRLDYYLWIGGEPIYHFLIEEVSDLSRGSRTGIVYPKRKK